MKARLADRAFFLFNKEEAIKKMVELDYGNENELVQLKPYKACSYREQTITPYVVIFDDFYVNLQLK